MSIQKYQIKSETVQTLLHWIDSDTIDIPVIQRPFVWPDKKIVGLIDSLYRGFPIGYLITQLIPGTTDPVDGHVRPVRQQLIDGQQRIATLRAAIRGKPLLTKTFDSKFINIAFHPLEEQFCVSNTKLTPKNGWIPDISHIFGHTMDIESTVTEYVDCNPDANPDVVRRLLHRLKDITHHQIGIIELQADLPLTSVSEIFTRINSTGVRLGQTDFAMSKLASNVTQNGSMLRKAIDYFCHVAKKPDYRQALKEDDPAFVSTEYFKYLDWVTPSSNLLYCPDYKDLLRVSFMAQFDRAKIADLSALLSGHDFEGKMTSIEASVHSFMRLKDGVQKATKKVHFERFTRLIRSTGFIAPDMIRSQHAINFAYVLYLRGKDSNMADALLESWVQRYLLMSLLSGRYSGSLESTMETDIRSVASEGVASFADRVINTEVLTEEFWSIVLPREIKGASQKSRYLPIFHAAQIRLQDQGFLSKSMLVKDIMLNQKNLHHIYPKNYLTNTDANATPDLMANLVLTRDDVNFQISDTSPNHYFPKLVQQCNTGCLAYGDINTLSDMRRNFAGNCIPAMLLSGTVPPYAAFIEERARLIAQRLHAYFRVF